jgi:esterase/lipase superfamily enzyme
MLREYYKWFSPNLGREMELVVFGHAGTRVLVFPTRVGRFYDYENFGMVGSLQERLINGCLQLFCVDSLDAESLYCFWKRPADRILRHVEYEQYLLQEVIPFSAKMNPGSQLISHGCSLGAYHAVNLAFRHPDLFVKVVGLSGRYDLTLPVAHYRGLFDDYFDETIYFNMPSQYIPNLQDERLLAQLRRLHIILAVGERDPFLDNNRHLSGQLWCKGAPHEFHVWTGKAHCPVSWRQMVSLYL